MSPRFDSSSIHRVRSSALPPEVLDGHVAEAEGDATAAITHLREGARLEDALAYGEPPEWSVPVRQELGMMLLRADRATEAEQVF